MSKYKYILFDADNTLFDFSLAEHNSFQAACSATDTEFTEQLYRAYSAINDSLWKRLEKKEVTVDFIKTERFRRLLTEYLGYPDSAETLAKAEFWRENYMSNLGRQSCLIDGAEEICAVLSGEYRLYIVTNGISRIQRSRFTPSKVYKYITELFISEEIGAAKPAREYFDFVIDRIGDADRTKYLVVGDSLTSDCDGAIASGLDICFYNPKNLPSNGRQLTYNITKLSELNDILL
ncbi:MAG: YjjG family noncanonical pyrimidine nucleotidase [Eubacteriales bacterium]